MSHYEIFEVPLLAPNGCCVGHVDYLDLLCALIKLTTDADQTAVWPSSVAVRPEEIQHLTRRANDWTLAEAGLVGSGKFFYADAATSVARALWYMGRGVRHLLVVDGGAVQNMLSQSDMLRRLAKELEGLGAVGSLTLGQVGLGDRAVLCVRNSDAALDSFFELGETGLSGAAIINDQGKLVGNLSRHDLLGTQGGIGFGVLNQSIMHYQRKHRVALAQRLVTVTLMSTLSEVITLMAREKVERVFVVETGMMPRGLVTQTDICRVLASRLGGKESNISKKSAKKLMKSHKEVKLEFPLMFPPE